jgi:two-component system chemotaxis response regulator CheY
MRRIMVVDDSETIRRLLSFILKRKNYMTIEAEDGMDAIEKLLSNPVDLIIVDLNMPNMDGIEFVRTLRGNYHQPDVPVIMLTTTKDEDLKKEALRAGVNLFLNKPISPEMLIYKVEGLLGRS